MFLYKLNQEVGGDWWATGDPKFSLTHTSGLAETVAPGAKRPAALDVARTRVVGAVGDAADRERLTAAYFPFVRVAPTRVLVAAGLGRVTGNTDVTAGVVDPVTAPGDPYLGSFQAAVDAGTAAALNAGDVVSPAGRVSEAGCLRAGGQSGTARQGDR